MLENLTYFLNGASLSFFAMGAFHMAIYARQSKSRPHYLFTICLIWMALIELKEFFLSHDAAYNYEILGPGFTSSKKKSDSRARVNRSGKVKPGPRIS